MNKKTIFTILTTFIIAGMIFVPMTVVLAEQSGSTPESGATSRIKTLYDSLVVEDKGVDSAGSWGDWGMMWNRIYSATEYTPIDFSLFQYSTRDNYAGTYNGGTGPEDYTGEESEWTDHSVDVDTVWKDERTGLYWSADRGTLTANNFTLATCQFSPQSLDPAMMEVI